MPTFTEAIAGWRFLAPFLLALEPASFLYFWPVATAAFGAGLSRDLLASYLPAFFIAGALCVIAAAAALTISKAAKPAAA